MSDEPSRLERRLLRWSGTGEVAERDDDDVAAARWERHEQRVEDDGPAIDAQIFPWCEDLDR